MTVTIKTLVDLAQKSKDLLSQRDQAIQEAYEQGLLWQDLAPYDRFGAVKLCKLAMNCSLREAIGNKSDVERARKTDGNALLASRD